MSYLLDTCVVSDLAKGDEPTIARLKTKRPFEVKISSITAYELDYGLRRASQMRQQTREAVLGFLNDIETLSFDRQSAKHAAEIRATQESGGTPIGAYDILIGATALAYDLVLVTSNTREFERIRQLKMENWKTNETFF